jgi:hypothetical protein
MENKEPVEAREMHSFARDSRTGGALKNALLCNIISD